MATTQNMRRPIAGQEVRVVIGYGNPFTVVKGRFMDIVTDNDGRIEGYSILLPETTVEAENPGEEDQTFEPSYSFISAAKVISMDWLADQATDEDDEE